MQAFSSPLQVSAENIANAGLSDKVHFIVGPAQASLQAIPTDAPKFDMAFIDADWQSIPKYFQEAKRIVRSGGVTVRSSLSTE